MSTYARIADSPYAGGVLHKLEETTERLARIRYKRGYSFSAEIRYDQVFVIFKAHVEDSRWNVTQMRTLDDPVRKMIDIQMAVSVPAYVLNSSTERSFYTWFRDRLFNFEQHESLEWYRVDDEIYKDPHA